MVRGAGIDPATMRVNRKLPYNIRVDPKPRPNHRRYLEALSRMTPEQKLSKAFELSEMSKTLFLEGLRERFPQKSEAELRAIAIERLEKCHNRNY